MPFQGRGGGYGGGFGGRGGGGGFGGGRGRGGGGRGGGFGGGRRNQDSDPDPNSEQFRKLFIGGLSYETTQDNLKTHFEQFGSVIDCVVMKNPDTGKSRGFGFVTYQLVSEIDEAQRNRTHNIDGRDVETKRAMPRDSGSEANQQSIKKMFIGGVPPDTTEDMVREVFAEFGNIESVDLVKDKNTGNCKGFCFVTFDDYDPVDKAVLKKKHDLNGKVVEVKKAQPKESGQRAGLKGGPGGRDQGYGGGYSNGGGYGNDSYGGGYGGGYGGANSWSGGYGDYNQQWGNSGGFGSGYSNDYGGGAMKSGGYGQRSQGPYGGGYGSGGGGYGGGGGFRR